MRGPRSPQLAASLALLALCSTQPSLTLADLQQPAPPAARALELGDPALVEALAQALASTLRDDNTRDQTLLMLRRLRDPALLPLLVGLSIAPDPQLQLHGLLGLAELDDRRQIDLLSVRQLPTPNWRSAVVQAGFDEGLIDDALIPEVCAWPDLDAGVMVRLAARLAGGDHADAGRHRAGVPPVQPVEPARLTPLLDDARPEVAVLAAILLVQTQDPLEPPTRAARVLQQRLGAPGGLPIESATQVVRAVADARLTSASQALTQIATSANQRARDARASLAIAGPDAGPAVATRGPLEREARAALTLWAEALATKIVVAPADPAPLTFFASAWDRAGPDGRASLSIAALDAARRLGPLTPQGLAGAMEGSGNLAQTSIADAVRALASDDTRSPANRPDQPTPAQPTPAKPGIARPLTTQDAPHPRFSVRLSVPVAVVRVLASPDADLAAWAMRVADDRPAQDAAEIRARVLALALAQERASTGERGADETLRALGVEAASELAQHEASALPELEPDATARTSAGVRGVRAMLLDARTLGEAGVCRVLLMGLLRSAPASGAHTTKGVMADPLASVLTDPAAWPTPQTATLALILACRTGVAQPSEPQVQARLSAVALDAEHAKGHDAGLRALAAWLALRGLNADRIALARVLAQ